MVPPPSSKSHPPLAFRTLRTAERSQLLRLAFALPVGEGRGFTKKTLGISEVHLAAQKMRDARSRIQIEAGLRRALRFERDFQKLRQSCEFHQSFRERAKNHEFAQRARAVVHESLLHHSRVAD